MTHERQYLEGGSMFGGFGGERGGVCAALHDGSMLCGGLVWTRQVEPERAQIGTTWISQLSKPHSGRALGKTRMQR